MQLTQSELKYQFDYIDGEFFWKYKCHRRAKPGMAASFTHTFKTGEVRMEVRVNGKTYLRSRLIFLWHKGWLPDIVDHEDRNPLNDKIENLRAANKQQNNCNRKSRINSTSQYLGVSWHMNRIWIAQISTNEKKILIGSFKSEIAAALAYNNKAVFYHGEFANLNIINN